VEGVKKYIGNLGAEPRDPMIYPELEFLELKIVCDAGVADDPIKRLSHSR